MYVGHMYLQGILFQGQGFLVIEHGGWDDFWGHLGMGLGWGESLARRNVV